MFLRNVGTTHNPEKQYCRENLRSHKDCNVSIQDGGEHAETLVQAAHSDGGTVGDCAVGDGTSRNCAAAAAMTVYHVTFMFVTHNIMYIINFIQM
jgi:diacylglycerol kinase family enzyme